MQQEEKIIAKAIGKVIKNARKQKAVNYSVFCDTNLIPSSTLDTLEKGQYSPKFYTVFKAIKALNMTFADFAKLLENENNVLPRGLNRP